MSNYNFKNFINPSTTTIEQNVQNVMQRLLSNFDDGLNHLITLTAEFELVVFYCSYSLFTTMHNMLINAQRVVESSLASEELKTFFTAEVIRYITYGRMHELKTRDGDIVAVMNYIVAILQHDQYISSLLNPDEEENTVLNQHCIEYFNRPYIICDADIRTMHKCIGYMYYMLRKQKTEDNSIRERQKSILKKLYDLYMAYVFMMFNFSEDCIWHS